MATKISCRVLQKGQLKSVSFVLDIPGGDNADEVVDQMIAELELEDSSESRADICGQIAQQLGAAESAMPPPPMAPPAMASPAAGSATGAGAVPSPGHQSAATAVQAQIRRRQASQRTDELNEARRAAWVDYYVEMDMLDKARELGWTGEADDADATAAGPEATEVGVPIAPGGDAAIAPGEDVAGLPSALRKPPPLPISFSVSAPAAPVAPPSLCCVASCCLCLTVTVLLSALLILEGVSPHPGLEEEVIRDGILVPALSAIEPADAAEKMAEQVGNPELYPMFGTALLLVTFCVLCGPRLVASCKETWTALVPYKRLEEEEVLPEVLVEYMEGRYGRSIPLPPGTSPVKGVPARTPFIRAASLPEAAPGHVGSRDDAAQETARLQWLEHYLDTQEWQQAYEMCISKSERAMVGERAEAAKSTAVEALKGEVESTRDRNASLRAELDALQSQLVQGRQSGEGAAVSAAQTQERVQRAREGKQRTRSMQNDKPSSDTQAPKRESTAGDGVLRV